LTDDDTSTINNEATANNNTGKDNDTVNNSYFRSGTHNDTVRYNYFTTDKDNDTVRLVHTGRYNITLDYYLVHRLRCYVLRELN